jgi:hypothetical protein
MKHAPLTPCQKWMGELDFQKGQNIAAPRYESHMGDNAKSVW